MKSIRIALVAIVLAPPAWAQLLSAPGGGFTKGESKNDSAAPVRKPSALPGARGPQGQAAPAERPAADLKPTEALFDAVNRGDLAAARDAIGRGAELEGRNILGLTPLDLAIDLGRNELTFLLLSMRGTASNPPPPPAAGQARTPVAAQPRPVPVRQVPIVAAPVRQRQVAGATGTPVPEAGFLGFGGAVR